MINERNKKWKAKNKINYYDYSVSSDNNYENASDEDYEYNNYYIKKSKKIKKNKVKQDFQVVDNEIKINGLGYFDRMMLSKLPNTIINLDNYKNEINNLINKYKYIYLKSIKENNTKVVIDKNCIPICANIINFDFNKWANAQLKYGGRLFDVIMMDPPWKLANSQPSRGVAINYDSLEDNIISQIPIKTLQTSGFLFIWVINAKFAFTIKLMEKWGYKLVDEIIWVKKTTNNKIAKGNGFYLQHSKETCLIGAKNLENVVYNKNIESDVIFSKRRGQSQKPNEIYSYIKKLKEDAYCLEIFGRRNNLQPNWVTIGNEI